MGIPDLQTAGCEDAGMQRVYRGGDLNLLSFAHTLIDPRENTNENLEVPKTSHVPQKKELIGFHCLHSNRWSTRFDATKDAAHGVKNRVDERKDCCDTEENDGFVHDNSPFAALANSPRMWPLFAASVKLSNFISAVFHLSSAFVK
jgi:hypothetical protein